MRGGGGESERVRARERKREKKRDRETERERVCDGGCIEGDRERQRVSRGNYVNKRSN